MGMKLRWIQQEDSIWRVKMGRVSEESGSLSLDREALQGWLKALEQAKIAGIRALVIEGEPGTFCQGMDLSSRLLNHPTPPAEASSRDEVHEVEAHYTPVPGMLRALRVTVPVDHATAQALRDDAKRYASLLLSLRRAPFAVIALVDGEVMAGGVGIMAAADLVLATGTSRFGLPEASLGLLPAMVLPILRERISAQKARWWTMRSASIGTATAHQWGLIDEVCADVDAMEKACREALRMILRAHPDAIADMKLRLGDETQGPLDGALEEAAEYTAHCLMLPDRVEGIRSFLEGEPLPWHERLRRRP